MTPVPEDTSLVRTPEDMHGTLDEVVRAMAADSASLLLLDQSGTCLDPYATVGLDRTARLAARVPLGQGFAGRVAATRQALALREITTENMLNPVLGLHGVRSVLGVPLIDGDDLIGVLHVGSKTPRTFTVQDELRLAAFSHQVATVVRAQAREARHTAAITLQRSLLPALPAELAGLDAAVRYLPAEGDLGGDWYDVFRLPDERIAVVMGDVVGHGLNAAVVMGRLKSALRAYALEHDDPAVVLGMLDRKISHFEQDALATVIYGVASPPYREFVFSSAGHWPPIQATSSGGVRTVDLPTDLLLGVDPSQPRSSTTVRLEEGALLCLFTDGLVERRTDASTPPGVRAESGLERLKAVLDPSVDAETNCRRVVAELVAQDVIDDDVALLVLRAR